MTVMTFWLYIGFLVAVVLTNYRVSKAIGWSANNEKNAKKLHKMVQVNHALILLLQDKKDGKPNNQTRILKTMRKLEDDIPPEMLKKLHALARSISHEAD